MARLTIIFDDGEVPMTFRIAELPPSIRAAIKHASLDVAGDLSAIDIYKLSERLAALLLEQCK